MIPSNNLVEKHLINDNTIQKLNINNYNQYEDIDEPDYLPTKSFVSNNELDRRPKIFCCGTEGLNVKSLLSRPGGAVKIVTDARGRHTTTKTNDNNDDDDDDDDEDDIEVGENSISTITLSPTKLVDKIKIEYLSDNHLDKIGVGPCFDTFSDIGNGGVMPSTSARSQNDLIQFVFTSHGIRVISDKEYVV